MTHEQTDTAAPTGAVSVMETPVYPMFARPEDADMDPYTGSAAREAVWFVAFVAAVLVAGLGLEAVL